MIEAVMLWNEPNNLAHWNFALDPDWSIFARMITLASRAIRAQKPDLPIVLGGISPIDPRFILNMQSKGVMEHIDAVAVHGFPFDWNHWTVREWPDRIDEIRAVCGKPVWVSETGVSTFGADEVQDMGLAFIVEALEGRTERIHWYSLFDLPLDWEAVAHNANLQDSEYVRHFFMGLLREDGTPKPAARRFAGLTPELGICQWFHYRDQRLEKACYWLRKLGVRRLRTGFNWADSLREGARGWFDCLAAAIEGFDVCATFCFTPKTEGIEPHHASPPREPEKFAEFCAMIVRDYG